MWATVQTQHHIGASLSLYIAAPYFLKIIEKHSATTEAGAA